MARGHLEDFFEALAGAFGAAGFEIDLAGDVPGRGFVGPPAQGALGVALGSVEVASFAVVDVSLPSDSPQAMRRKEALQRVMKNRLSMIAKSINGRRLAAPMGGLATGAHDAQDGCWVGRINMSCT